MRTIFKHLVIIIPGLFLDISSLVVASHSGIDRRFCRRAFPDLH